MSDRLKTQKRKRPLPPSKPPEEVAAEGLYIAVAATRLLLKNRIVVEILNENRNFDPDYYLAAASEALLELAEESRGDAERLEDLIRLLRSSRWRRGDRQGYRREDIDNLKGRLRQAQLVERTLRERADDQSGLREIVTAAHEAAWGEISRNIHDNLEAQFARVEIDEDDREDRERRKADVGLIDLPRLERELARNERLRAAELRRKLRRGRAKT